MYIVGYIIFYMGINNEVIRIGINEKRSIAVKTEKHE